MLNRFNWDTWTNKNYYGTVHLISSDPLSRKLNVRFTAYPLKLNIYKVEKRSIPSFSLAA